MQNLKRDNLIFGRYRLQQSLGKGSFGEVFYAEDLQFDPPRSVAFKLLHPQYTTDAQVREDLKREAGILARFDHPNILNVLDFGITEEIAFIVMELAQGGSLARRLRPDPTKPPVPLPLPEVATYLDQMADALDEAHDQGLIHRDIKPQNILLDRRGRILVADFGLATAVTGSSSSVMVDTSGSGTPLYMSPEQWQGRAGRASDIYSLGAVLFQMVSGYPPYQGNQFELFGQHLNTPVPRLSDKAPNLVYPPALDDIIAFALAKDPRQRVRPAKELARLFRQAIEMHSQPTIAVQPVTPRPSGNLPNAGTNNPLTGRPPFNPPTNPPLSNPGTGYGPGTSSGSGYPPGSISGSNFPAGLSSPNYQPNNFNQPNPNQAPPRPYENKPNPGSNPPGSYQGGNPAATSSFQPYQGPTNQSQSGPAASFSPLGNQQGNAPVYPVSGSQPKPSQPAPVSGSQPRPAPAPVVSPTAPVIQPASTQEKKGIPVWVWLIAAVIILLVAGAIAFVVINGNNSNQTGPNTAQVTNTPANSVAATTAPVVGTTAVATTGVTTPPATTAAGTTAPATTEAPTTSAPDTTAVATTAPATTPPPTTVGPTPTPAPYGTNFATFQAHNNIVLNMAYSPDGKTLATASEDGTVKLWDTSNNQLKATLAGHTGPVRAIAFAPNGKYLVSGSADKTAFVWDLSNNSRKYVLSGQTSTITSVAFNPDSNSLATGSDDKTIFLWNLETGQKFGATFKDDDNVTAVAYSPDGKTLAAGSQNGSLKMWDLGNAQPKPAPLGKGHDGTIWSLTFSHNGKYLATGSLDKTTRLWDIDGDKVSLHFLYDDSTQGVRQVAFTPDDTHLISACDDTTAYIWDTVSGNGITKLSGNTKEVYAVAISPDGRTAATGTADGVVKLWSLVK